MTFKPIVTKMKTNSAALNLQGSTSLRLRDRKSTDLESLKEKSVWEGVESIAGLKGGREMSRIRNNN